MGADKKAPEEESQSYHYHQLNGGRFNGSEVPTLPEMALEDTHKPQHGANMKEGAD